MLGTIKDKKYIYIKKFFTQEELDILQKHCLSKTLNGIEFDKQSPHAPSFYSDELMEILLETKLKKVEEISGLKLFKTYCYWRGYVHKSILNDHKDRPSCEVSVTANIDSCGTKWPIHMNGKWIDMEIGDAVMYLGCDVTHGRKPFEGTYCAQVFFHYVDQNGPYAMHKDDQIQKTYGSKQ